MAISMDEIRLKAGSAIFALANRSASKGRNNPDKLREAIAYYDIAASITPDPNRAYAIYQKALLLEELGDYAEAEQTYFSLTESAYASSVDMSVARCRAKQQGNYDLQNEANKYLDKMATLLHETGRDMSGLDAIRDLTNVVTAKFSSIQRSPPEAEPQISDEDEEMASSIASEFVHFLLDKNYTAAKAMLHTDLKNLTAKDLQNSFESLFVDEPFPDNAIVFDLQLDWATKTDDDLAAIYITIDSDNNEAVRVVVTRQNGELTIRNIEWGRP